MASFKPISLNQKRRIPWAAIIILGVLGLAVVGYLAYDRFFRSGSPRWTQYRSYQSDPDSLGEYRLTAGMRCEDAPFAFPTTGAIFGLWDQSYRPGHRHSGLDIFAGTEPGVTPVYAAYSGFLTRLSDWTSTVIIRIPNDPLHPGDQVWTYYTHMATKDGESFVSDEFPPGTTEVYVPAGTLLGYQGNYSGDPINPTGLHLHFSVVKDDGSGTFLNETEIRNTYDPSPYFGMAMNNNENPDEFPFCDGEVTYEDWGE
jgi:murein DD-endopeptidase MepM/ murein hydrolase activator NlpD